MAHPQIAEADDAPVSEMDSAAAAFGKYFDEQGEEPVQDDEEESEPELEEASDEGDLDDEGDDRDDEESEPVDPAIAAPVSLNDEEKAVFAQLPEEAQRAWAASETRRNAQVQQATTKASEAQRNAEATAAQADANARKVYAAQLREVVKAMVPAAPSPELARTDPAEFIAQKAQYDAEIAQLNEFMQHVEQVDAKADEDLDANFIQARDRELLTVPEVRDEATREQFFQKAVEAATALGLETKQLNTATAGEWQKLRQIHDWKTDAEKYRTAMAKQMKRVREAKKATAAKPNAAQPNGSGRGLVEAKQRLKQSGDVRDAAAAFAKLGRI